MIWITAGRGAEAATKSDPPAGFTTTNQKRLCKSFHGADGLKAAAPSEPRPLIVRPTLFHFVSVKYINIIKDKQITKETWKSFIVLKKKSHN